MRIRNKKTGQIFEVMAGTLYPKFYEEVKDDEIKVGEPKVEFEIEETPDEPVEPETPAEPEKTEEVVEEKPKTTTKKSKTKKTTKKGKKNGKN